jgi:hypothetical protein
MPTSSHIPSDHGGKTDLIEHPVTTASKCAILLDAQMPAGHPVIGWAKGKVAKDLVPTLTAVVTAPYPGS